MMQHFRTFVPAPVAAMPRFVPRAQCDAYPPVLFAPCGVHFQKSKNEPAQHGVKALDGGDADAADTVELRGLQVLNKVKLGELAAVAGRDHSPFRARGWVDRLLEF